MLFLAQSTTEISVSDDSKEAKFSLAEQIDGTYVKKPKKYPLEVVTERIVPSFEKLSCVILPALFVISSRSPVYSVQSDVE